MVDYRAQVFMGLSLEKVDNKALYASNALHAAPVAHNFLTNVVLFSFLADPTADDASPFQLNVYNHPFPDEEVRTKRVVKPSREAFSLQSSPSCP